MHALKMCSQRHARTLRRRLHHALHLLRVLQPNQAAARQAGEGEAPAAGGRLAAQAPAGHMRQRLAGGGPLRQLRGEGNAMKSAEQVNEQPDG